ncbi:MAG TPA: GntR family transcriptional regulator, partial [Syntrophorhabdaceae bacterium]|nr:GntR family transcriptional regulator [Syntrophorhabdaceae bacterium]
VAETLRRRIMTDEYMEDSLIPPVPELEKEFNVSNITIRKALETLTQEGLLRRKRGVGTIVQKCERDLVVLDLSGGFRKLVRSIEELPIELEVLEIKVVPAPNYVRQVLTGYDSGKLLRVKKIRRHAGKPLSYYVHYTDPDLYPLITKELTEQKTFVATFEEVSTKKLTMLKQRIEAVVADIDLSEVLQVRFGLPLFFTENLYFTEGNMPAILTQNYYRGDKCFYKTSTHL